MTRAAIGLGSNIEHRLSHLREAAAALAGLGDVSASSSLYETAPVGGPDQGSYLNAVILLDTELDAGELLARLQEIEAAAGRTRDGQWGPRTLDLDILLFGEERHDSPELVVPHPRITERRFVLAPLAEVWPDAPLPAGQPSTLLEAVRSQEVHLLARDWTRRNPRLVEQGGGWVVTQGALLFLWLVTVVATDQRPVWSTWRPWLGLAVAGAGVVVTILSAKALGRSLSPFPAPLPGAELIEKGPYTLVRHPIYTGIVLTLLGVTTVLGSWPGLLITLLLLGFFAAKSIHEEGGLGLVYPGYGEYQTRVRHRLIPGLW
ncbi:MAG TPA: 2-amino-4-hydroxy-6-hydroxymethyldihydropteridine diphosphokinase [Acidimicrobiia bacterium]|nr:2-amino-4-hydroxy-6-hydroxymethyldihydropteridine diphosphokinase [Acidimicrobiia bacterium]